NGEKPHRGMQITLESQRTRQHGSELRQFRPTRSHSSEHVPAIDGVRGIAILLVIIYHSLALWPSEGAADRIIHLATGWAWSGVDLFFVLSGLLNTGILLDARGGKHYFRA